MLNYSANFKKTFNEYKKTLTYDNFFDLAYGFIKQNSESWRKNEDKIDLSSKLGYDAFGKLYYAVLINFKSQFASGYKLPNDSVIVSKFLAPAWVITSIGLDWKPKDYFTMYVSPATGKFTIVNDANLAAAGAYGVEHGKKFRPEFGAYFKAVFKKDIMKNINLSSKLELFDNYTDKRVANRKNVDVNFENNLLMKVNKYISATLFFQIIYDDDINIKHTVTENGIAVDKNGPTLQFKQVLGVAMSYKL